MKIDIMDLLGLKNGDLVTIEGNKYRVIDCILDGEGPLHHKHIALLNGAEFKVHKELHCNDFTNGCEDCPLRCLSCQTVNTGTLRQMLKDICHHYGDPDLYDFMLKRIEKI